MSHVNLIEQFKKLISDAPVSTLKEIITISTNLIIENEKPSSTQLSEDELSNTFKYIPDIFNVKSLDVSSRELDHSDNDLENNLESFNDESFMQELELEFRSLGLDKKNPNRPATQWILNEPHDHPDLKNALPTSKFKAIPKLMSLMNSHDECVGTLSGGLVNFSRAGCSRRNPHADDEDYIDQETSIMTFSLGADREFAIYEKKRNDPQLLKKFTLKNRSVMVMQPGSQGSTKHMVMSSSTTDDVFSGERFSFSCRGLLKSNKELQGDSPDVSSPAGVSDNISSTVKNTSVIFGTSISKYLDEKKLQGKKENIRVINCSVSGAMIPDVSTQMDAFFTSDIRDREEKIKNVFICVGTNDVTKLQHGPNHLYLPIVNLIKKAKLLFKGANIYFQSLLPMPLLSQFTRSNVLKFNDIVLKACVAQKCFYLDVFGKFLDEYYCINPHLFRFNQSRNCIDVHLNSVGLGILARSYIDYIRPRRFNPIKF